jgi:DNA-binding NarL/FixJ family response regulator
VLVEMPQMLREIVREFLATQDDIEVVGEVGEAASLPAAVERYAPDLVVVGGGGLRVPGEWFDLLRSRPSLRLLAVASHGHRTTVCEVLGDISPQGLVDAIKLARARS